MPKAGMSWSVALLLMLPLHAQKTSDACASCHAAEWADFKSHLHFAKGLHCDACHAESAKHSGAARTDRTVAPERILALCGRCHSRELQEYTGSNHGKLVLARAEDPAPNCVTCHGAHRPQTARETEEKCLGCHLAIPNFFLNTAPRRTGKVACVDCHSVHAE
jgi:hypothetical protein